MCLCVGRRSCCRSSLAPAAAVAMLDSAGVRVIATAVASRVITVLIATCSSCIISSPYDTSSSWHHSTGDDGPDASHSTHYFSKSVAALGSWDSVFYAHIAGHGYQYEKHHMAQPTFPLLMRTLGRCISSEPTTETYLLAGAIISNVLFVAAAFVLFRLGARVLRDDVLAERAAYLFSASPASIFFSAVRKRQGRAAHAC